MAYIFLDESGDLGFDFSKKKTSQYFVVACVFVENKRPVEKVVKKVFSGFSKKEVKNHHGILHFFKERPVIRKKVLKMLNSKDIKIIYIYLNKKKVYTKLQNEKHVLYNYVTNILLDRICTNGIIPINKPIQLVASQRETNRFLNDNFSQYLQSQAINNHRIDIKVVIKTPRQEKSLQVADAVSWALFREIEHKDSEYIKIIESKIIEKNPLFP
jgi:hypothetical protein